MRVFKLTIWLLLSVLVVTTVAHAQDQPTLKITLLNQKIWRNADGPTDYRTLRFRFVNLTKHPIIIHGHGDDDGFHPVSYSIRFDELKKEWIYPTTDNSPISWKEIKYEAYHTHILSPQKSVTLEVAVKWEKPSELVKKIFFIADDKDMEPYQIMSSAFRLK